MESKREVRKKMIALRNALPQEYRKKADAAIAQKLLQSDWYGKSTQILVYAAIKSEVDLAAFCRQAWADGKELYFPKVEGDEMEFYRVDSPSDLVPGTFGVPEPVFGERLLRMIPFLTPILVPGVAFSADGRRIGYGKGFYDRYLTANQKNKRLFAIGIAYSCQLTDGWEADAGDYPMQEVVTE